MKAEKALPILVYLEAALATLAIVIDRSMTWFLPGELRGWLDESAVGWGAADWLVTALWIGVSAVTILAWIGLVSFWRPARSIYTWTWVVALLLLPLESAWIHTPAGYMLDVAATLAGGALLGVLYFSDARVHFERPAAEAREIPTAGTCRP
jgi:hypothetical protein